MCSSNFRTMPPSNNPCVELPRRQGIPSSGYPSPLSRVSSALSTSYYHTLINTIIALAVLATVFFTVLGCLLLCVKHKIRRAEMRKLQTNIDTPPLRPLPPMVDLVRPRAQSGTVTPAVAEKDVAHSGASNERTEATALNQVPTVPPPIVPRGARSTVAQSISNPYQAPHYSDFAGGYERKSGTRTRTSSIKQDFPQLVPQATTKFEAVGVPQSGHPLQRPSSVHVTVYESPFQSRKSKTDGVGEYMKSSNLRDAWPPSGEQRRRLSNHRNDDNRGEWFRGSG